VGPGATVTGVDFTLAQGGRISGHVTSTTGTPLVGVTVNVYTQDREQLGDTVTDASGAYSIGGLAAGSYLAATTSVADDYVDEMYLDVPCPECGLYYLSWPSLATPIPVGEGATATVDFALAAGGSISGSLTNASSAAPIQAAVELYDRLGGYVRSAFVTGSYSFPGLPAGKSTSPRPGSRERSERSTTTSRSPASGSFQDRPSARDGGYGDNGDRFRVVARGEDRGHDHAGIYRGALEDAEVGVYDANGNYLAWASTDAMGQYQTEEGLPTGDYFGYAYPPWGLNLSGQLYKGIDCFSTSVDCSVGSGDPIHVTAPATKTGVDFALTAGGSVSGTVTDAGTGLGIPGARVYVYTVSRTGSSAARSASTSSNGTYTVSGSPRRWLLRRRPGQGLRAGLYDNISCLACTLTTGQKVQVRAGATTSGVNFALAKGGAVRGFVTSAASGFGVSAQVGLFDGSGAQLGWGWSPGAGAYAIRGLPAGTYYLETIGAMGHLDELYDNLRAYSSCDPVTGTGVAVSAGSTTSGIDFVLAAGGTITGFVRDDAGTGTTNGDVTAYASTGLTVGRCDYVAPNGFYQVLGLPAGNHHLLANGYGGLVSEVYDDVPCLGCNPTTSGTAVPVSAGGTTSGIDFTLSPGGALEGTVTDTLGAPRRATVRAYNAAGDSVGDVGSDYTGYYRTWVGLRRGLFAAASASGLDQQLYDGLPAPAAIHDRDADHGDRVATTTGIDFRLRGVPQTFYTLTPAGSSTRATPRERGGPALSAKADRNFAVTGTCDIPLDARALSVNVVSTGSTAAGHLRLHGGRTAVPFTSAVNYSLGQTRGNNAIVPLGQVGELAVYCGQGTGTTDVIVDVNGYFK
jgi:hypothetical protein